MGLDMYLTRKIYVGAYFPHREVKGRIDLEAEGKPIKVNLNKVSEITERVIYWRKANSIHNWFVQVVQCGVDDCKEYLVDFDQLLELKNLCDKVMETKNTSLLPPLSGFFFGSTAIDNDYWDDLAYTSAEIEKLDNDCEYFYRSSW